MNSDQSLRFKIASEASEFEQIHQLNYRTFVEEIPQHEPNPAGSLVDTFDKENTYIIALKSGRLVGMIAVRDKRPFSLERKLENLDSYLPEARSVCELRLLSVEKSLRNSMVFRGLARRLALYCNRKGYDLALISAFTQRVPMYRRFGFVPFGPLIGKPGAFFQPMYLTRAAFERHSAALHHMRSVGETK